MISLQSMMAYNLDEQGILPEKFADLALRPKTYEWYQKYLVSSYSSGIRLDLFRNNSGMLNESKELFASATEYTFETKLTGLTGSYYENGIYVEHHSQWTFANYQGPSLKVSKTKANFTKMNAGMGYQDATKSFDSVNEIYVKLRTINAERKSTGSYSFDGITWTAIKTDTYDSRYWGYHHFWISAPSLESISLRDTKLIVDGRVLFDGAKSQRIQ